MIVFLEQLKWQLLVFRRNNLIAMIFVIALFYMIIVYFLSDAGNVEKFTTLLILNVPAMTGFIFIGLSIILEKDQEILPALFVTPLNIHTYLITRIIILSSLGLVVAVGMVLMAKGTSFDVIHFSFGAFTTCVIFSFIGIYVVSFTTEILHFLLRSVPLVLIMSFPVLNYFELANLTAFKIFPVYGSLILISNSYQLRPNYAELTFGYLLLVIWIPALYWFAAKTFKAKRVEA